MVVQSTIAIYRIATRWQSKRTWRDWPRRR